MRIAQLSDTHLLPPGDSDPAAQARAAALAACVADINRLDPLPDAVLHTGDVSQQADDASYALARDILSALKAPVYVVPGNRDLRAALRRGLGGLSPLPQGGAFLHYVVDRHPLRLIGLDSQVDGRKIGGLCAARRDWLEAQLAVAPDRPAVLFMHHPAFYVDEQYPGAFADPGERDEFFALLDRHVQVVALICGHFHRPAECRIGRVRATTMGSIATDLAQHPDWAAQPSYALHDIADDGSGRAERRGVVLTPAGAPLV